MSVPFKYYMSLSGNYLGFSAVPCATLFSVPSLQTEEMTAQQEEGAPGKKKRKKKKKKSKGAGEDAEAEAEEPAMYQAPPKFEVNENDVSFSIYNIFKFWNMSDFAI